MSAIPASLANPKGARALHVVSSALVAIAIVALWLDGRSRLAAAVPVLLVVALLGMVMAWAIGRERAVNRLPAMGVRDAETLAEALPEVVWMADPSGAVQFANRRWYEMSELTPEQSLGQAWQLVTHPDDLEATLARWAHSLSSGEPFETEYRFRQSDGSYRWYLGRARAVRDERGAIVRWIGTCTDIQDQKMAVEAIRRSEQVTRDSYAVERARDTAEVRFRAVQDASPDPFMLWDIEPGPTGIEEGTLVYCNPAAERLVGKQRDDIVGKSMSALFPSLRASGRMELYSEVYRTGVTREITYHHEMLGVWLRLVVIRVGDGLGMISSDVTRSKSSEDVLRRTRDELEQLVMERTRELHDARDAAIQANRAKSDFLSRASHELRTPLSSVIGFSNILLKNRRGALAEEEITYLSRIAKNGRNLLALVNDLLDLSKIEAGRVDLELSPVSLFDVLHEVKESLAPRAAELGLALNVDVSLEHDLIIADEARLRQVLVNLAGNAIKYTTAGSVTVRVVCNAAGAPSRIDVIDTGPGIAADRLDAIFQPFIVDATPAAGDAATGLGLAITRALCDLMGYRLTVESRLGAGSTFSVHLLAAEAVRLRQIA